MWGQECEGSIKVRSLMCHIHKQSLLPMLLQGIFPTKKALKQPTYRKTSTHGAKAVVFYEASVQMKNAQKHCKYQGFLLVHLRPDVLPMLSSKLFVQTRGA